MSEIADDMEVQIQQQGVASYKVKDGDVFVFTVKTLETLLESARKSKSQRAFVCVKSRPLA